MIIDKPVILDKQVPLDFISREYFCDLLLKFKIFDVACQTPGRVSLVLGIHKKPEWQTGFKKGSFVNLNFGWLLFVLDQLLGLEEKLQKSYFDVRNMEQHGAQTAPNSFYGQKILLLIIILTHSSSQLVNSAKIATDT